MNQFAWQWPIVWLVLVVWLVVEIVEDSRQRAGHEAPPALETLPNKEMGLALAVCVALSTTLLTGIGWMLTTAIYYTIIHTLYPGRFIDGPWW